MCRVAANCPVYIVIYGYAATLSQPATTNQSKMDVQSGNQRHPHLLTAVAENQPDGLGSAGVEHQLVLDVTGAVTVCCM